MRVLYVNHTAAMSGAEHSLLVLLRAISDRVSAVVAVPPGPLAAEVQALGFTVHPIPGTELSARLHPLHTARGLGRVAAAAARVRELARRLGTDLIHANTPRAGLMTTMAEGRTGALPIVHVRDSIPPGRLPRAMFRLLARRSSLFVPTSEFLASQLPPSWPRQSVANAVEPDRFDPQRADRAASRARLGLSAEDPVLVVVGQISPHKGQSDAIRTLELVRRDYPTAQLLIVGSVKFPGAATRYDNDGYGRELRARAASAGLSDCVHFLGERGDVADVLACADLSLVPSWYEPFGRVALEAMIMGVPVVATAVGGIGEVVTDGLHGLILAPRDPETWAQAVGSLLSNPARRAAMGQAGRERALADFSPAAHARDVFAAYVRVLS